MVLFLSYYEPFAGLCNQLYLITNHIHSAYVQGKKIYIHKFNIDIFKKNRIPASEFFDLHLTNLNLEKLLGPKPIETEMPGEIENIPQLCIYPVSSIEILNCLEFNENVNLKVKTIKGNFPDGYYSIHFRLDIDAIIHYTFGKDIYTRFMDLANNSLESAMEYFQSLDLNKMNKYCSFLMKQYFYFLLKMGFDKTWYISTSLTKWDIHNPMIPFLKQLVDFILNNGGVYYISPVIYQDRELNALVDLLVLRDSIKLIGFEGSSFSEGYCLKVNTIRKVTTQFFFVKEYEV